MLPNLLKYCLLRKMEDMRAPLKSTNFLLHYYIDGGAAIHVTVLVFQKGKRFPPRHPSVRMTWQVNLFQNNDINTMPWGAFMLGFFS